MGKYDDLYLRKNFKSEISKLKRANIVHSNFKSLKNFLNKNLKNVESWWENKKTKKVVNDFTKKFSHYDDKSEMIIKKICQKYK